jgi:Raf kinase inhibitor-like YbhB/YbcL family protein
MSNDGWAAGCVVFFFLTTSGGAYALELTSPAFRNEQAIPAKHACDDADSSPPLAWSDVPDGTESFALLVEDPDAPGGTFAHWILYELAGDARELPEGIPTVGRGAGGVKQGQNDFRQIGYGGPCPPPGDPHRYVFHLYALDDVLGLAPGATRGDLLAAIRGHVLAETTLVGKFARAAAAKPTR